MSTAGSFTRRMQHRRRKLEDRYTQEVLVYLTVALRYINLLLITFCAAAGRRKVILKYFILHSTRRALGLSQSARLALGVGYER